MDINNFLKKWTPTVTAIGVLIALLLFLLGHLFAYLNLKKSLRLTDCNNIIKAAKLMEQSGNDVWFWNIRFDTQFYKTNLPIASRGFLYVVGDFSEQKIGYYLAVADAMEKVNTILGRLDSLGGDYLASAEVSRDIASSSAVAFGIFTNELERKRENCTEFFPKP